MTIRIIQGDARLVLATLPAESVHCVVTSPPYFGLRDYSTATWEGGEDACDHLPPDEAGKTDKPTTGQRTHAGRFSGKACWKCGATRIDRQIGLEKSPSDYLETMVAVFREVRRVMRPDATCWINIGDSYASSGPRGHGGWDGNNKNPDGTPRLSRQAGDSWGGPTAVGGYKPKDLLLMPARLALALQADGWWVRSDIIWHKPNPMPESVTDRPTSAHEHVFLLTKSARYFFDSEGVREESSPNKPWAGSSNAGDKQRALGHHLGGNLGVASGDSRNLRNVWTIATHAFSSVFSGGNYRIASRDCAVHDRQADLAHVLECDARQDVFAFGRNPGRRSRPAELPEGAVVSIPLDRSELPSGVSSAIGHSSQTHRTPALSERDVIFGDISGGHTEYMVFLDHFFAMYSRKSASNTAPGASPDVLLSCQPVQSQDRIVGIATFEPRPSGCSCYYAGIVHKRQDHFASFPPELAERCIRAGTSERGCCAACGAPWVRVTTKVFASNGKSPKRAAPPDPKFRREFGDDMGSWDVTTTGWSPSCTCPPSEPQPCTVLDCFAGAFTAPMVADRLQRHAIGIELSEAYCSLARARMERDAGMFLGLADQPAPVPEPPEDARIADLFAEPVVP